MNESKDSQSEPVKQKAEEEEELPNLKDPEVQKATSLIQVSMFLLLKDVENKFPLN